MSNQQQQRKPKLSASKKHKAAKTPLEKAAALKERAKQSKLSGKKHKLPFEEENYSDQDEDDMQDDVPENYVEYDVC